MNNSKIFLGIIGDRTSDTTEALASFIDKQNISQISFTAQDNKLSDMPKLLRTAPSYTQKAKTMVSVLKDLKWEKVAIVYSEDSDDLYEQVLESAVSMGLCVTVVVPLSEGETDSMVLQAAVMRVYDTGARQVVYIGGSQLASQLFSVASSLSQALQMQWLVSFGVNQTFASQTNYNYGLLTLQVGERPIAEFEDHWVRIVDTQSRANNPWYQEAYMTVNRCQLPGNSNPQFSSLPTCTVMSEQQKRASFVQKKYTESAVMSIYSYANALKKAHQTLCGGTPGLCPILTALSPDKFFNDYLKGLDFTFTNAERVPTLASSSIPPYNAPKRVQFNMNGDIMGVPFDVYNYKYQTTGFEFVKVGSYVDDTLTLSKSSIVMYDNDGSSRTIPLASLPMSACVNGSCEVCYRDDTMDTTDDMKYVYVPGDILIGSSFAIHSSSMSSLSCDLLDHVHNSQFLEAFLFAIEEVNKAKVLGNLKLGTFATDNCKNPLLQNEMLLQLRMNKLQIKDAEGRVVDPSRIVAYFKGFSHNNNQFLFTDDLPILSYGNPESAKFHPMLTVIPYSVPGDKSMAMAALLKSLGHTYVQIIYQNVPNSGLKELLVFLNIKDILEKHGICVAEVYPTSTLMEYRQAVKKAAETTGATALVYVSMTPETGLLFEALQAEQLTDRFALFGIENWGISEMSIKGYDNATDYSFALTSKPVKTQPFLDFLSALDPNTYNTNPWFKEWYEWIHSCSLTSSANQKYPNVCPSNTLPITSQSSFEQSPQSILMMNSVYVIANAIRKTLVHYCGANFASVCSAYRTAMDRGQMLTQYMQEAQFYDVLGQETTKDMFYKDLSVVDVDYVMNGKYTKVGEYNAATTTSPNTFTLDKSMVQSKLPSPSMCPEPCPQCLHTVVPGQTQVMEGDLLLGGLFDIHDPGSGLFNCGGVGTLMAYQHYAGFLFALDIVNKGTLLRDVKLGSFAMDTCVHAVRGATLMSGVQSQLIEVDDVHINDMIGWVTHTKDEIAVMASMATGLQMPLIGPNPVLFSEVKDDMAYYLMMQTMDAHTEGIASVLDVFSWKYVHIVIDDYQSVVTQKLHTAIKTALANHGICIMDTFIMPDVTVAAIVDNVMKSPTKVVIVYSVMHQFLQERQRVGATDIVFISGTMTSNQAQLGPVTGSAAAGLISVLPDLQPVSQFDAYIGGMSLSNNKDPWFQQYYMQVYQCDYGTGTMYGKPCDPTKTLQEGGKYTQDMWISGTINAVYAMSYALDKVLKDTCGQDYTNVCMAYKKSTNITQQVIQALNDVSFKGVNGNMYKFNKDRQNDVGYVVSVTNSAGNFQQFGSYLDGKLSVTDTSTSLSYYSNTPSGCATQCAKCTGGGGDIVDETFTYKSGDLLIAGIFDIHNKGSTSFTCGSKLNSRQGYQLLEAFNYAMNYVNDKKGMFKDKLTGVTLGSFSLDSCKNPTRIGNLVANVMSQTTVIKSGDQQVNPDKIVAYIGAYDSDSTMKVADILSDIHVAQVSYGATSVTLKNSQRYPYFLRSVPSDDKQAKAMVAFLRRYNMDYVQIIRSEDLYGSDGAKAFSELAHTQGICVAQTTVLQTSEGDININANEAVSKLFVKANTTVVVVFLSSDYILPLLQAAQRNIRVIETFRFIGSESWSDNPEFIKLTNNAVDAATNSVSLGVETNDVSDFDKYLNDITVESLKTNPWFQEFYEDIMQCSLTAGDANLPRCNNTNRGITVNNPKYRQDQYVLYVVNAVFAAALGINSAITRICGANYNGLCAPFSYSLSQRDQILTGIKQATFTDVSGQRFSFTEDGGSTRGYQLYSVVKTAQNGLYRDIGTYNNDNLQPIAGVSFTGQWQSKCDTPATCTECPTRVSQSSPFMDSTTDTSLNIIGFFSIHSPDLMDRLKCGQLNTNGGFQNMLAFYYALNKLPGNIAVGGVAMDTCGSTARVTQGLLSLATGDAISGYELNVNSDSVISYLTLGNKNTRAVSSQLDRNKALIMSPTATDSAFLNWNHYFSVVTPDIVQAKVMAQLVKQMDWIYIAVIYSSDMVGQSNAEAFIQESNSNDQSTVCVSEKLMLSIYGTIESSKALLRQLNSKPGLNVVVLFVTPSERELLMQAASELNLSGRFLFIGSHSNTMSQSSTSNNINSILRGSINFMPKSFTIPDFHKWVSTLTRKSHGNIPDDWFDEFWQHVHQCDLETATVPQYNIKCSLNLKLRTDSLIPSTEAYNTIISTQMLAQGVFDLQQCRNTSDHIQTCFSKLQDKYSALYTAVKDATWVSPDEPTQMFRFNTDNYGNTGIDIYNYQITNQNGLVQVKIGSWDSLNGLTVDKNNFMVYNGLGDLDTDFKSTCPTGETCTCIQQTGHFGTNTGGFVPVTQPTPAALKTFSSNDYFGSALGIILVALTALGILITILLFVYLLLVYPVKGGTSVIGYLLLFAVLLLYILNFAFIVYPNTPVCAVRRFCLGVIYALIFACMLVKVLNTWRIGDAWDEFNPPTYERLSHPCSLFSIVFGLMLVQVIIGAEWLILQKPGYEYVEYEGKLLARCTPTDFHNEELVMSCIYVMVLILLTMIFAAVTWDSEENNKESRWILVVCLFTIIIWIIWTIVTTLTELKFRDPAIVIASLVNATVILLCIYIRKLYLLSKIQKEIEEDKKSQLSTLSREKLSNHGNGYYVNPAYSSLEVGSLRSNRSRGSQYSHASHPRSQAYSYQADAAGADVAY